MKKEHIATIHEGKKEFKCDICNSKFWQKGTLNQHVLKVHEKNNLMGNL